ncbi:hypothetical protein IKR55_03935 [bacterium]|nr:hypothetical protein [bacterium]
MTEPVNSVIAKIKADPNLFNEITKADAKRKFTIDGKTYTAEELNIALRVSLSKSNGISSEIPGFTLYKEDAKVELTGKTYDKAGNIITYPKEGETFDQTAKRLGIKKGTPEYDEFVKANQEAKDRRWFKVGEKIIIPPSIQDKINEKELIDKEQSKAEVEKWEIRIGRKKPQKPNPEEPDPVKPNPVKPDPIKPDPIKPDPVEPNPPKPPIENPKLDNYYGDSRQMHQGDCYLLASINAIRNAEGGQELLQKLRTEKTVNGKKVYKITLPGAKIAARGLKRDKELDLKGGMFITGEYTFTEDEVNEILSKAGTSYSQDDGDVILLEAAFEKYREEVKKTLKANNIPLNRYYSAAGLVSGRTENNILEGGYSHDATFIITGKKSKHYRTESYDKTIVVSKGDLDKGQILPVISGSIKSMSVDEIDGPTRRSKEELEAMLDNIQEDLADGKSDLVCTTAFRIGNPNERPGGHAFTIKRVTADSVILINPWYPDQELEMSREFFMESATHLDISKPKENLWDKIKNFFDR